MAQDHIMLARQERQFYKDKCAESKEDLTKHFEQPDGSICAPLYPSPGTVNMTLQISFDFAQQVE